MMEAVRRFVDSVAAINSSSKNAATAAPSSFRPEACSTCRRACRNTSPFLATAGVAGAASVMSWRATAVFEEGGVVRSSMVVSSWSPPRPRENAPPKAARRRPQKRRRRRGRPAEDRTRAFSPSRRGPGEDRRRRRLRSRWTGEHRRRLRIQTARLVFFWSAPGVLLGLAHLVDLFRRRLLAPHPCFAHGHRFT